MAIETICKCTENCGHSLFFAPNNIGTARSVQEVGRTLPAAEAERLVVLQIKTGKTGSQSADRAYACVAYTHMFHIYCFISTSSRLRLFSFDSMVLRWYSGFVHTHCTYSVEHRCSPGGRATRTTVYCMKPRRQLMHDSVSSCLSGIGFQATPTSLTVTNPQ